MFIQLFILFLFLFFSALLSGFEVALFLLSKKTLKDIKIKNSILGEYLQEMIEHSQKVGTAVFAFKSLALVCEAVISIILALKTVEIFHLTKELVIAFLIIFLTIFIVVFVEILPKKLARKYSTFYSVIAGIPVAWIIMVIYPIIKISNDIFYSLLSVIRFKRFSASFNPRLFKKNFNVDSLESEIKHEDKEIIESLKSFKRITVREVMTPRVDIIAISNEAGFKQLINIIVESTHSRIPLYKENLDNIIGIIYAKDLLPYLKNNKSKDKLNLEMIAKKVMFVPETKLIGDLMSEFQEKKMHISMVVDEFGGTSGLVSMDDILEEIVGEIKDEYDVEELEITKINNNTFLMLGRTSIEKVGEELNLNLHSDESYYDTIGGFVLNYSGFIPKEGYSFTFKNHKFTVKEINNRRINKIQVEVLSENK